MALLFEDKVKVNRQAFVAKVKKISEELGIDPNWLMAVINLETGGTFSPSITNQIGCVGLVQFCADKAGGTYKTIGGKRVYLSDLKKMSNVEQLDYVKMYFEPYADKVIRGVDMYMATFFPAAIGKDDEYVLQTDTLKADTIARQNPKLNLNKDGQLTVGEVNKAFLSTIPAQMVQHFKESFDTIGKAVRRNKWWIAGSALFIGATLWVIYQNRDKFITA